jgi:hypothetical protein
MRAFLNCGFGDPIADADFRLIESLGFAGIRQDVPAGRETLLVRNFARTSLRPLFLLDGDSLPQRAAAVAALAAEASLDAAIEVTNEPDVAPEWQSNPAALADVVRRIYVAVPDFPVVTGGITSTSDRGLSYIERLVAAGLPPDVIIGYHSYRTTRTPETPLAGFASREAEFDRLRLAAAGRRLWNTEVGWHTAPFSVSKGFPLCFVKETKRWTDQDVAGFLAAELELNAAFGAEIMTVYQLNDGPSDTPENRFGIRRQDGSLKPSASVAQRAGRQPE